MSAATGGLWGVPRLWRTLRCLKPGQIAGRMLFRLRRPRPDLRPAPPLRPARSTPAAPAALWVTPPRRPPSLLSATRMRFLAVEHDLAEVGWDHPTLPLLWRYNQHYFDDLNARGAAARRTWHLALVAQWLEANPPGPGTAWAPYPTSLRIVNWVKWLLPAEAAGDPVLQAAIASLAVQARWLVQRLEWHLLGNHLFANAKALVFAGLFFDGPEAERWLGTGLRILERELPEQVLADGAQFERSPMYHALALEDVLDLVNVIQVRAAPESPAAQLLPTLQGIAGRMLHWLRCLRHPDGALARFNDCAEGIAPAGAELERYAAALGVVAPPAGGEGVLALQPSGYVRAVRGAAVLLLDAAPVGPDYLPGHAHADTLSFELSLRGVELVVNRGTSEYGLGPRRQVERGTAAHSTVQVADADSSEVWAGFRVGRRAQVREVGIEGWRVEAAHDGYAHLPGGPVHRRRWELGLQSLTVLDRIEPVGASAPPAVARFHFGPGLACEPAGPGAWAVLRGEERVADVEVLIGRPTFETWDHARGFGELVSAITLAVSLEAGVAEVRLTWRA